MFNVGGGEVLAILLLALMVLGPDKLPDAARQAGKYLAEFRRMSNGFQQEIRSAMDIDMKPSANMAPTDVPSLPPLGPASAADSATGVGDDEAPLSSTPPNGTSDARPNGPVHMDGPSGSFD